MNAPKIIYWIVTTLFSLTTLLAVSKYFTKTVEMQSAFTALGFPSYIVLPLGFLKLCGLGVILWNRWPTLREWAYAGFVFNIILAISAHLSINQYDHYGAYVALILILSSYFFGKKIFKS